MAGVVTAGRDRGGTAEAVGIVPLVKEGMAVMVGMAGQGVARAEKGAAVPKVTEAAEGMGETMMLNGNRRNGSGLPSSVLAALLFTNVLLGGAESTQEPPQPPTARDGKDGTPQSPDGKPGENGQHGAKGQDGGKGGNSKRGNGGDGGKGGNGLWGGGKGGDGGDAE